MYNAVQIKKILLSSSILALAMFCSCGNSGTNEALSLYNQAKDLYVSGAYEQSITLLDSLKKNYTDDIDLLKKGLHLRTLNQEGIIKKEMEQNDSLLSVLESEVQQLSGKFKYIKLKDMVEGYYIYNDIANKTGDDNRSTIEPRIDEDDAFFVVSFLKGQDIKHTSVKLSSSNGSVTTSSVAYDGAQNYRYKSDGVAYESITFTNAQCDTLGQFALDNPNANIKLVFCGKKQYSTKFDSKMQKALVETYRYANCKKQGKSAIKKKMFLEQKLQLAQKQIEQTKIFNK